MVSVPLAAAAVGSDDGDVRQLAAALSVLGTFSIMPLMPDRPRETMFKWALALVGHATEITVLRRGTRREEGDAAGGVLRMLSVGPLPGRLVLLGVACLGAYCDS